MDRITFIRYVAVGSSSVIRHLAAILAADIVGYSALMQADQDSTLADLRQLRSELFGPTVAGHRGKVIKSMGDGWLVEFSSAVDAVSCALQIQDRLARHQTIKLRIGIHIGDVVHEDEDVFGDGVNIASRLEALAEPGAVAVSDAVHSALDGTLRPSFDDVGEQSLKNIDRAVRIWMRVLGSDAAEGCSAAAAPASELAEYPKLAIVPVTASDNRDEVREMAAALTCDLSAYLGATSWLQCSTTNDPGNGVYVLYATLRSHGDRLRLDAHLEEPNGATCWSDKFDGDLAHSFAWQDEVGEEIAAQSLERVLDLEKQSLAGKALGEMTAEQCNLRGLMEVEPLNRDAARGALRYYAAAIEKKPNFTKAYSDAILMYVAASGMALRDVTDPYTQAFEQWLNDAAPLATDSPMLELAIALWVYRRERDSARLKRAVRRGLRQAPFTVDVRVFSGWANIWLGEPEEALDCFAKGRRLIRFSPWAGPALAGEAVACVMVGRDDEAIGHAKRGLNTTDGFATLYRVMASAHALQGREAEATEALMEVLRLVPGETIQLIRTRTGYADTLGTRRYFEGLRLAGMPEGEP
jgi:adenylate cyclase